MPGSWGGVHTWDVYAEGSIGCGKNGETSFRVESNGNLGAVNISVGGSLSFGSRLGQLINLWDTRYGIGMQHQTQYYRTDDYFAWYKKGQHSDTPLDPGQGGTVQMVIKDGNVGIGTSTPADTLEVAGNLRILTGTGSNPIRFTSTWSDFSSLTDAFKNRAEISNDTKDHKTLMIVGNRSKDQITRMVSVWDRLEVNGQIYASGNVGIGTAEPDPRHKLTVAGEAKVAGLNVSGKATAKDLDVTGEAKVAGLNVSGKATAKDLDVTGEAKVAGLNVSGKATAKDLDVTQNAKFTGIINQNVGNTTVVIDSTGLKLTNLKSDAPATGGGRVIWGDGSQLQPDQGGSIELGGNHHTAGTGTPYIDFHYKNKMEDHNARIINDADGRLSIIAGQISATGDIICNGGVYAKKGLHFLVGNQWKALVEFLRIIGWPDQLAGAGATINVPGPSDIRLKADMRQDSPGPGQGTSIAGHPLPLEPGGARLLHARHPRSGSRPAPTPRLRRTRNCGMRSGHERTKPCPARTWD